MSPNDQRRLSFPLIALGLLIGLAATMVHVIWLADSRWVFPGFVMMIVGVVVGGRVMALGMRKV